MNQYYYLLGEQAAGILDEFRVSLQAQNWLFSGQPNRFRILIQWIGAIPFLIIETGAGKGMYCYLKETRRDDTLTIEIRFIPGFYHCQMPYDDAIVFLAQHYQSVEQ